MRIILLRPHEQNVGAEPGGRLLLEPLSPYMEQDGTDFESFGVGVSAALLKGYGVEMSMVYMYIRFILTPFQKNTVN